MDIWYKIEDKDILHVWVNDETNEEVEVSPDFYENNGEPCDDCGNVLRYAYTLIKNLDPTTSTR